MLGVLQPSVGIPFKPLEDCDEDEEDVPDDEPMRDEVPLVHNTAPLATTETKLADADVTRSNWLNHSQFVTAARLMSTPFVENMKPPILETLQCSSIEAHDDRTDATPNVSSSSYNANTSKGLSPILECSDEDAKTGSSRGSSHSSGISVKSNVHTSKSVVSNCPGASLDHETTSNEVRLSYM